MSILVTGATGRVGSRFVPRLLERTADVRILARQPERADALRRLGADVVAGDLLRPNTLARALAGVEAVIHLAAFFRSTDDAQVRATTADGTIALAQAAAEAGVRRFLFTSTNLVYGPGRGRPAREDDEPKPTHTYPASKVAAERALQALHARRELGGCVLRLAFVYGDGDPHLEEGLQWFRRWHPEKRIHMVHHADVAQALLLALEAPAADGRIYNVADDEPVPGAEILRYFGESTNGANPAPSLDDPWEGIVDTTRIRTELGFRPRYPTFAAAREADTL